MLLTELRRNKDTTRLVGLARHGGRKTQSRTTDAKPSLHWLKTHLFLLFQKLEGLRPKLPPGRLAVTASLTRNRDKSRRYLFTKNRIVCQSSCYAGGFFKGENPFGL